MSSKQHYQVQWVQKDSNQQSRKSPNRKENIRENTQDYYAEKTFEKKPVKYREDRKDDRRYEDRYQEDRKAEEKNTFQNHYRKESDDYDHVPSKYHQDPQTKSTVKKWRNSKQETSNNQLKQINDVQNRRYGITTLVAAFIPMTELPPDLLKVQEQFPSFFSKTSLTPLNVIQQKNQTLQRATLNSADLQYQQAQQTQQRQHVGESDPEWMTETAKLEEVTFDAFDFKSIENLLDEKRASYQKDHGTFERKCREKEEKSQQKEEKNKQEKEIHLEKAKYKQMKEDQIKQNQTTDIFRLLVPSNDETQNIQTLEQIERSMSQQFSPSKAMDKNNIIQQQQLNKSDQTVGYKDTKLQMPAQQVESQRLIPQIQLGQQPFSVHALLNGRKIVDPIWFYLDQSNKIQGGFHSVSMDQWYQQRYLALSLKISWLKPGQWISLEQFLINLEQVSRGQMQPTRAAESTQASQVPGLEYMIFMKQQQQKMVNEYNQYQAYEDNQNNQQRQQNQQQLNQQNQQNQYNQQNRIQSTPTFEQVYKMQQMQLQAMQLAQSQQLNQSMSQQQLNQQLAQQQQYLLQHQQLVGKTRLRKIEEVKEPETLFNIGLKKQSSQPQTHTSGQSGIVIDSTDFPSLSTSQNLHLSL